MHPSFDLKTRAHAYYVQNHFQVFQDIPEVVATWAECLHTWKTDGKSSPIVDLAFSALALSVYARFQNCRAAEIEACKVYLELLQHMQISILHVDSTNPNADEIDAYLLGSHFMARYESFVQNQDNGAVLEPLKQINVWYHFDGAEAVLKFWYDHRRQRTPSRVIKHTRRKLIKSALLREQQLPGWLADGNVFGESDIALEFDCLIVQFLEIHHRYLGLKQAAADGEQISQNLDNLVNESRQLGCSLRQWSTSLSSKWQYVKHILPEISDFPRDEFLSAAVISCPKLGHSAVWTEYFAMRMLTSHTHLRLLDLTAAQSNSAHQSETLESLVELKSSADSLAALVPFCLKRIRIASHQTLKASVELSTEAFQPYLASLVVWPMSLASSLQKLEPAQRQWFRSALHRVSKESSACLLAYAMSDYWALR